MCLIMHDSFLQEIADESDLTKMERGRLESEFKEYAVEAKQTIQQLRAENMKLREDLNKERHDNELTCKSIMREDAGSAVVKSRTESVVSAARGFELIHDGKRAHPRSEWIFAFMIPIIECGEINLCNPCFVGASVSSRNPMLCMYI